MSEISLKVGWDKEKSELERILLSIKVVNFEVF